MVRFYGLTYLLSWLFWSPYYLPLGLPVSQLPYVHVLGCLGPLLAAFGLTYYEQGGAGIRHMLGRGWTRLAGTPVGWAALGLLAPVLLLAGIALGIYLSGNQSISWKEVSTSKEFSELTPVAYILINLLFYGFGEEIGWRGYVLPRLQTRFSALTATLLMVPLWAIWHWPLFFNPLGNYIHMDAGGVMGWLFSLATGSVLFTWLFNSSGGNVVACAFFHGMMDIVFMTDLNTADVSAYTGILITVIGFLVLIVYRKESLSQGTKITQHE